MAYLVGKCLHMCPLREQQRREHEGRLHKFEILPILNSNKKPRADPKKAVKEFQRPAAGSKQAVAEDVRPPHILRDTTTYLMTHVLPRQDVPWVVVYDFIFDRLRAIRQDITIQQCLDADTICVFEQAARFYVYAEYRLCEESLSNFDPHINATHLQECLKQLIVLYKSDGSFVNSSEILAFYLLHNLGSSDALTYALSLPHQIRNQPSLKFAIATSIAWMHGNYVRVLRLVCALPYLEACSVMRHLSRIRRHALLVMSAAYSSPASIYPVKDLTRLLVLENDTQTEATCLYYGVNVAGPFISFSKRNFYSDIQLLHCRQYGFLKQISDSVDIAGLVAGNAVPSREMLKDS